MKQFLVIVFLGSSLLTRAQQGMPAFYTVVSKFCRTYALPEEIYDSTTRFAKKPEGWFVQQVKLYPREKVLQEQCFYSPATAQYNDLSTWYQPVESKEAATAAQEKMLQPFGSNIDWYCYDRARYYGYDGWHRDMIAAYSSNTDISDSLLDVLARAYSHQASQYLWYQQGGHYDGSDTLQQQLARLQYPSPQRLAKVKENIYNSMACYKRIEARNPAYQTIVGDVALKRFSEAMHGWNQMMLCGDEAGAAGFLDSATLAAGHIQQAKNHLNSCKPNAILFTYGDNDTYQLWYVQQKLGYRRDVTVINNNLLGVSMYVNMLRQKKWVNLLLSDAFLHNENAYYAIKKNAAKQAGQPRKAISTLKAMLLAMYNGTCVQQSEDPEGRPISTPAYLADTAVLLYKAAGTSPVKVKIPLGNLLYVNDIIMLDIIAGNADRRPVYFTSDYDSKFRSYLQPEGILYRLYPPGANNKAAKAAAIKALEQFARTVYVPVCSRDDRFVCYDGDAALIHVYTTLIEYYHEKKDNTSTNRWLAQMQQHCPVPNRYQVSLSRYLCYLYVTLEKKDLLQPLAERYAQQVFAAWQQPDVLQSSLTGANAVAELKQLRNYLVQLELPHEVIDKRLAQMEE